MESGKKPKRRRKKAAKYRFGDPFGLRGLDIPRPSIRTDEVDSWFSEMREILEARWGVVEKHRNTGSLHKRLGTEFGRTVEPGEAMQWFQNARQDHEWRMKLLDPRKAEGQLYLAYSHLVLDNDFFEPAHEQKRNIRDLFLFVLDLDDILDPLRPPSLRSPEPIPGDIVGHPTTRAREDWLLPIMPMEGLRMPRRFGKVRASQEASRFVGERSEAYWRSVRDYLRRIIDSIARPYGRAIDTSALEDAISKPSIGIISTVRSPLLHLSKSIERRRSSLTIADVAEAKRLFKRWYRLVQKLLKVPASSRKSLGVSEQVVKLFNDAYSEETQAQRITLQMVRQHLELGVSIDTLRKKVKSPSGRDCRRK